MREKVEVSVCGSVQRVARECLNFLHNLIRILSASRSSSTSSRNPQVWPVSRQPSLCQVHQCLTFPVQRYAGRAPRRTCCLPSSLQPAVQLPEAASPPLPAQPMLQRSKPQLRPLPQEESGMASLRSLTRCRQQPHWLQMVHPPLPKGPPSSISETSFRNESSP